MPRPRNRYNESVEVGEPPPGSEPEDWWDVAEDLGGWAGDYLDEGQALAGEALDTLAEGGADAARRAAWAVPLGAAAVLVILGVVLIRRV